MMYLDTSIGVLRWDRFVHLRLTSVFAFAVCFVCFGVSKCNANGNEEVVKLVS